MTRAFIVFNPAAGQSHPDVRSDLERHFADESWAYEIHETTEEEDLVEVVRTALDRGANLFVAAGGDGTVSAVAGGLVRAKAPLGIVPLGTGNTLARELDIPLGLEEALHLVTGEHALANIDAMRVDDRFFVLNVSVGLSALTMRDTEREDKRRFGRVAYVWTGLRKFFGYQPHRFVIGIDGRGVRVRASEVVVANSGAAGDPSLRWRPRVRLDDGRLDVCIVQARSVLDYVRLAGALLLGRQKQNPNVHCLIAERSVSIGSTPSLPVQADGEFIGWPPVQVQVVPGAVQIIVPGASEGRRPAADVSSGLVESI